MKTAFNWDEVNALISLLRAKGVLYLMGSDETLEEDIDKIDPVQLIQRLAACGYPLVEDASISLFILHPELAPSVIAALQVSDPNVAEKIAVLILATLYLQQWWFFRLAFTLGRLPSFPEMPFTSLWETRGLPSPSSDYGLNGLLALQDYQRQHSGLPLNFLHDWQNQIDHLLAQEQKYQRQLSDNLKQTLKQVSIDDIARYTEKEQSA